jgi:hypothetical protein
MKDLSESRVLIVDDDRSIREALQNHMKDHSRLMARLCSHSAA